MTSAATAPASALPSPVHSHVFLGAGHERSERKTWAVIGLCGAMMVAGIVGGLLFGSIALVADGMHMSTHAGALLLAALAYRYARRHATDPRFTFGTGKLGDLAGFTSAIILAMIAALIGYEAMRRFFAPVAIDFAEAIPIACIGLAVNLASWWLLRGGRDHHDHHGHSHGPTHAEPSHRHGAGHRHDGAHRVRTAAGTVVLEIFEEGVPPRFRLSAENGQTLAGRTAMIETVRPDGGRQSFVLSDRGGYLESVEDIPEPHQFAALVQIGGEHFSAGFEKHHDDADRAAHRDNNLRAAIIHVLADAAVSVLVIIGLVLARAFSWRWTDPAAGVIGAGVIASWSYGLIRDTGAILLDINPDRHMADNLRDAVENEGDQLADLHLWRLGPGHLGAIISVITTQAHDPAYYRAKLARFRSLSHLTIEIDQPGLLPQVGNRPGNP
ncbi:MAG TPA: CDF family Co(II)/Ni(II) efflux transporter DmeF [Stellaceae bacterium]